VEILLFQKSNPPPIGKQLWNVPTVSAIFLAKFYGKCNEQIAGIIGNILKKWMLMNWNFMIAIWIALDPTI